VNQDLRASAPVSGALHMRNLPLNVGARRHNHAVIYNERKCRLGVDRIAFARILVEMACLRDNGILVPAGMVIALGSAGAIGAEIEWTGDADAGLDG